MAKKSKLITAVYYQLLDMGEEEILHYVREFRNYIDYNIVEYGNLLVYYTDIIDLMERCDYKVQNYTNDQVWDYYKRIVREVVDKYFLS